MPLKKQIKLIRHYLKCSTVNDRVGVPVYRYNLARPIERLIECLDEQGIPINYDSCEKKLEFVDRRKKTRIVPLDAPGGGSITSRVYLKGDDLELELKETNGVSRGNRYGTYHGIICNILIGNMNDQNDLVKRVRTAFVKAYN